MLNVYSADVTDEATVLGFPDLMLDEDVLAAGKVHIVVSVCLNSRKKLVQIILRAQVISIDDEQTTVFEIKKGSLSMAESPITHEIISFNQQQLRFIGNTILPLLKKEGDY